MSLSVKPVLQLPFIKGPRFQGSRKYGGILGNKMLQNLRD